jgi:hypothetical protein
MSKYSNGNKHELTTEHVDEAEEKCLPSDWGV